MRGEIFLEYYFNQDLIKRVESGEVIIVPERTILRLRETGGDLNWEPSVREISTKGEKYYLPLSGKYRVSNDSEDLSFEVHTSLYIHIVGKLRGELTCLNEKIIHLEQGEKLEIWIEQYGGSENLHLEWSLPGEKEIEDTTHFVIDHRDGGKYGLTAEDLNTNDKRQIFFEIIRKSDKNILELLVVPLGCKIPEEMCQMLREFISWGENYTLQKIDKNILRVVNVIHRCQWKTPDRLIYSGNEIEITKEGKYVFQILEKGKIVGEKDVFLKFSKIPFISFLINQKKYYSGDRVTVKGPVSFKAFFFVEYLDHEKIFYELSFNEKVVEKSEIFLKKSQAVIPITYDGKKYPLQIKLALSHHELIDICFLSLQKGK